MGGYFTKLGLAASVLLALQSNASSERQEWYGNQSAVLSYGTPETDDVWVWFRCESGAGSISVEFIHYSSQAPGTLQVPISLSSDAGSIELVAEGEIQEMEESLFIEAQTTEIQKLASILSADDILHVSVDGEVMQIPLAGSKRAVAIFLATCS